MEKLESLERDMRLLEKEMREVDMDIACLENAPMNEHTLPMFIGNIEKMLSIMTDAVNFVRDAEQAMKGDYNDNNPVALDE